MLIYWIYLKFQTDYLHYQEGVEYTLLGTNVTILYQEKTESLMCKNVLLFAKISFLVSNALFWFLRVTNILSCICHISKSYTVRKSQHLVKHNVFLSPQEKTTNLSVLSIRKFKSCAYSTWKKHNRFCYWTGLSSCKSNIQFSFNFSKD